jgi:hypothetical protein
MWCVAQAVRGQPFTTALQNLKLTFEKTQTARKIEADGTVAVPTAQSLEGVRVPPSFLLLLWCVVSSHVTCCVLQEIRDMKRLDFFIVKLYGMLYLRDELNHFEVIEKAVRPLPSSFRSAHT